MIKLGLNMSAFLFHMCQFNGSLLSQVCGRSLFRMNGLLNLSLNFGPPVALSMNIGIIQS